MKRSSWTHSYTPVAIFVLLASVMTLTGCDRIPTDVVLADDAEELEGELGSSPSDGNQCILINGQIYCY